MFTSLYIFLMNHFWHIVLQSTPAILTRNFCHLALVGGGAAILVDMFNFNISQNQVSEIIGNQVKGLIGIESKRVKYNLYI